MFSRFRGKQSKEKVPVTSNDNADDSSKSQEQIEMNGVWADVKSYDALIQCIKKDMFKCTLCRFDLTKDQARNLFNLLESNATLMGLALHNQSSGDFLCPLASTLLQNNTTLQILTLFYSNISNKGVHVLANTLANSTTRLKSLSLYGNAIGDKGVIALVDVFKTNTQLRTLYLNNTGCGDEAMIALGKAMSHVSTLDELRLENNKITEKGAKALLSGILNNSSLRRLALDNNDNISKELLVQIKNRVNENYEWQKCECSKTEIGAFLMERDMHHDAYNLYKEGYATLDQVQDISNQMVPFPFASRRNELTKIKKLIKEERSTSSSKLPSENESSENPRRTESNGQVKSSNPGMPPLKTKSQVEMENEFAIAVSYDTLLQWIQDDTYKYVLYKLSLTMEQARKLFGVLMTNKSLSSLCLVNQSLGDYICRLASTLLQCNATLAGLLLSQSNISYDGADLIASALVNTTAKLKLLSLEGSAIGDKGAVALVKVLKTNTQLRCLNLTNTGCGDEFAKKLGYVMPDISTLDDLRLCNNRIGNTGVQDLLSGLLGNRSIVKLDLEGNRRVSEEYIVEIEKRCKWNKQVQISKCSETELGAFLLSKDMTDEAYGLYKEGYKTLDEIAETSSHTLCYEKAPLGLTYGGLMKVKDKVGQPSYCKSPMGVFLIDNGYEKHCRIFYRFGLREIRPLGEVDLKNIGIVDRQERVELIELLKEASSITATEHGNDAKVESPDVQGLELTTAPSEKSTTKKSSILDESGKNRDKHSSSFAAFACHHIQESGLATCVLELAFKAHHAEIKDLYLPPRAHSLDDFLPQVRKSPVFLVLLSKGFFSSKWCIAELIEAFLHEKPIVAVRVIDKEEAGFKRSEFPTLCDTCPVLSDVKCREFLRMKGLLESSVYALRELSKTLLIDFDLSHLTTNKLLFTAQVAEIKQRLHQRAQPPGCIYRQTGQSK